MAVFKAISIEEHIVFSLTSLLKSHQKKRKKKKKSLLTTITNPLDGGSWYRSMVLRQPLCGQPAVNLELQHVKFTDLEDGMHGIPASSEPWMRIEGG